jgi:DNA repair protein RAD5
MKDFTAKEISWINCSSNLVHSDDDERPEGKAVKRQKLLTNVHIGEITVEGQSLIKGSSKGIDAGDEIVFTTSKSISHVEIARFKHLKTGREIGKLSNSDASFIASMIDSGLACFSGSIIYIPSCLKMLETIYISVKVELVPSAFVDREKTFEDELPITNGSVARRKKLLGTLFERTGLIDAKQAAMCKIESTTMDILNDVDSSDMSKIFGKSRNDDIVPVNPAKGMLLTLRDYQKVGLAFMLSKERLEVESFSLSPLWIELMPRDRPFYLNPCSGELSFTFPKEHHTAGGILADEVFNGLNNRWDLERR